MYLNEGKGESGWSTEGQPGREGLPGVLEACQRADRQKKYHLEKDRTGVVSPPPRDGICQVIPFWSEGSLLPCAQDLSDFENSFGIPEALTGSYVVSTKGSCVWAACWNYAPPSPVLLLQSAHFCSYSVTGSVTPPTPPA